MPLNPLVSVLVNNYNYARFLGTAIESALDQDYPSVEVIVVDDGSTDESRDIVHSFGSAIVPVLKANGGQASAFNAGFAASRGDILCLLDGDDAACRNRASAVVEMFAEHREADWCFHALGRMDGNGGRPKSVNPMRQVQLLDARAALRRGYIRFTRVGTSRTVRYIAPATSGLCFRRALLGMVLPMPESPGITLHDNYLKFVAISLAPGIATSAPLGWRRVHATNNLIGREHQLEGRIAVNTAFWLKTQFPALSALAMNLLAGGLGTMRARGGVDVASKAQAAVLTAHLPVWKEIEFAARMWWNWLRILLHDTMQRRWHRAGTKTRRAR